MADAEEPIPADEADQAAKVAEAPKGLLALGIGPLLGLALVIGVGVPSVIWMMVKEKELSPWEKTVETLDLLEKGHVRTAYLNAMEMLDQNVEDPDIGGSLEYIVGVALFHKAEQVTVEGADGHEGLSRPDYQLAAHYLETANQKSLPDRCVTNWRYTLGACYFHLDQIYDARHLLEDAYHSHNNNDLNRAKVILMLSECYRDPNVLKASLVHSNSVAEQREKRNDIIQSLSVEYLVNSKQNQQDEKLFKAMINIADLQRQNQNWDIAEQLMEQSKDWIDQYQGKKYRLSKLTEQWQVLKAKLLLEQSQVQQALDLLSELMNKKLKSDQESILEGQVLLGLAYARDGRLDPALQNLEKSADAPGSLAHVPANFYAADVARQRGLHEKALSHFLSGLSEIKSIQQFANRLIDLDEARELVQNAWDEWAESESFEQYRFAVELSHHMSPLFPEDYSNRLTALVSLKRAELKESEAKALGVNVSREKLKEVRDYWKRAGDAYARLADSSKSNSNYEEILWEASQYYRNGNDFKNALSMLNRHIAAGAQDKLTTAYVFQAQLMLDMDGYEEESNLDLAAKVLQKAIHDFPKDQLVYDAQLLLGKVYLEQGHVDKALKVWRGIILESPLAPEANEWQQALFLLGQTLFHSSETRPYQLMAEMKQAIEEQEDAQIEIHLEHVDEAILWLREFIRRVPDHPRILEARWLLAEGLKTRAAIPKVTLKTLKEAEKTDNTEKELKGEIREYLELARHEYETLAATLKGPEQRGELTPLTKQMLREAYIEPAHIQFELGEFDETGDEFREAIELYSTAAFHFTGEPIVLIAYYRIAECYRRLDANEEARRQLNQARVILNEMEEPFSPELTNYTKQEWQVLFDQSVQMFDLNQTASN